MVSIDGARDAPVDWVSLTPIDFSVFEGEGDRDIPCGFSGTAHRETPRGRLLWPVITDGTVRLRRRSRSYDAHAMFMRRCVSIVNTPFTGTGKAMHVKGRVLEAGAAGCALLELEGSPAADWFPAAALVGWRDADDIRRLAATRLADAAEALHDHVRRHYSPALIYGEILDRVRHPLPRETA